MDYWKDRAIKSQEKLTSKNINDTNKQLAKYYKKTMLKVIDEFEATYDKLLATVEDGNEPTPADLYKLDKYWKMQAQLREELNKLGEKEIILLSKQFEKEWFDIYNSIALPSQVNYSTISKEAATQMINEVWCADGKSWSQRVWNNTEKLQETLNDELIHCVISGKKTSELKKILQERFNVSYHRATSLVNTEIAHVQTQAAKQRYMDYGIQEVQVWASPDERRCELCGKEHKKIYSIYERMPVPFHVNCRCCIIPVVE